MRKTTVALLVLCGLVLAACGTRLPDEAFVESGELVPVDESSTDGDTATDDGDVASETTTTLGSSTDGSTDGGSGGSTGGSTTGGSTTGGTGGNDGPNQASDVGVTATTITIGTIVAENGVLGDAFAPAARGMRAWAAHMNASGGIHGRQVILKTCDDGEVRNRALECARRLVEQDKVFAIVGANTRAMGGAAEYLNSKGVPVLGIPITNSYYRYPHFWPGYPFGYKRDGQTVGHKGNLIFTTGIYRWFKANLKVSKAAVFMYDIDESKQAGKAFEDGLKMEGFSVEPYLVSFAAPSFDQAVADMQNKGIQVIFDTMDDGANRKLCDAMQRRGFKPTAKVSTVVSFGEKVGTAYNDTCRNIVFIPGDSTPYTTKNEATTEFRNAFARYQPGKELHQWALETWGQGILVRDALVHMGAAPTRKGLEDYFRNLDKYTANGLFVGLDWRPINYDAPTTEDCFTIARWLDSKGGWVRATERFPFCYPDAKQYPAKALEQGN